MNDSCSGFIHQGMANVVIEVLVSLFPHSTERMGQGGYLGLGRCCNTGLTLTWAIESQIRFRPLGKGNGTYKVHCCELPFSHGHPDPGNSRSHLCLQSLEGHRAVGRLWALGLEEPQQRCWELQLCVEVIWHDGRGWK